MQVVAGNFHHSQGGAGKAVQEGLDRGRFPGPSISVDEDVVGRVACQEVAGVPNQPLLLVLVPHQVLQANGVRRGDALQPPALGSRVPMKGPELAENSGAVSAVEVAQLGHQGPPVGGPAQTPFHLQVLVGEWLGSGFFRPQPVPARPVPVPTHPLENGGHLRTPQGKKLPQPGQVRLHLQDQIRTQAAHAVTLGPPGKPDSRRAAPSSAGGSATECPQPLPAPERLASTTRQRKRSSWRRPAWPPWRCGAGRRQFPSRKSSRAATTGSRTTDRKITSRCAWRTIERRDSIASSTSESNAGPARFLIRSPSECRENLNVWTRIVNRTTWPPAAAPAAHIASVGRPMAKHA